MKFWTGISEKRLFRDAQAWNAADYAEALAQVRRLIERANTTIATERVTAHAIEQVNTQSTAALERLSKIARRLGINSHVVPLYDQIPAQIAARSVSAHCIAAVDLATSGDFPLFFYTMDHDSNIGRRAHCASGRAVRAQLAASPRFANWTKMKKDGSNGQPGHFRYVCLRTKSGAFFLTEPSSRVLSAPLRTDTFILEPVRENQRLGSLDGKGGKHGQAPGSTIYELRAVQRTSGLYRQLTR